MEKESLNQTKDQILESSRVSCRDCYRCIRVCPVKAIRVSKGQTHIEEDRCIRCGACVRACPVNAIHMGIKHTEAKNPSEKTTAL